MNGLQTVIMLMQQCAQDHDQSTVYVRQKVPHTTIWKDRQPKRQKRKLSTKTK